MNAFLGGDSFRFDISPKSKLEEICDFIAAKLGLPGDDPFEHVAAVLSVDPGVIRITVEAITPQGRSALRRLTGEGDADHEHA